MKIIQWILGMIASVSCVCIVLITSVEIAAYGDFEWYQKEYEKYNVKKDLSMKEEDIMSVTKEMMDYLRGNRDDLVIYTSVGGRNHTEFFNEQDKFHMADVQKLFMGGLMLRAIAIIIMIVSLLILFLLKVNLKCLLSKCFQMGLICILIGVIGIGVFAFYNFNAFFLRFHEMFFSNSLWIFDPRYDYMIRMLPEGLFADMTFRIGTIFVAMSSIILILSVYATKDCKKKRLQLVKLDVNFPKKMC